MNVSKVVESLLVIENNALLFVKLVFAPDTEVLHGVPEQQKEHKADKNLKYEIKHY